MPKKAMVFDVSEGKPAEEEAEDHLANVPLFSGVASEQVDHILVIRTGPIEEGTLGKIEPSATEEDIFGRWGGGKFRLQARDARSKPVKNGFTTMEIAGEPRWKSPQAKRQYDQMMGNPTTAAPAPAAAATTAPSLQDMLAVQDAAHRRELERIRLEADVREKERRGDDERRAREADEREERRRKDAAEAEDRRRKDDDAARARDREHQTFMLQLADKKGSSGGDMAALLAGVKLARSLGDNGPDDPVMALMQNLPAVLDKAGAIAAQSKPAAAAEASVASRADELTIVGTLGAKGNAVMKEAERRGIRPEQLLEAMFDQAAANMRALPPANASSPGAAAPARGATPAPAPPPAPASAPPPANSPPATARRPRVSSARARKATRPARRGTRRA